MADDRELVAAEAGDVVLGTELRAEALRDLAQQDVAVVVAERVVDVLEAVEVDQQQAGPLAVLEPVAERGGGGVLEAGAIWQTGERIVASRVVAAFALPDGAVAREHRSDEQRDEEDRVGGGRDHERRDHQQHAAGDDDEEGVVAEVALNRDLLVPGDGRPDQPVVDEEERHRGDQHGDQLHVPERVRGADPIRGMQEAHHLQGRAHRERVLPEVEADAPPRLAGQAVLDDRGGALGDQCRNQTAGEQQRERERRRQRDLLIATATRDLQREHLSGHDSAREDGKRERMGPQVANAAAAREESDGDAAGREHGIAVQPESQPDSQHCALGFRGRWFCLAELVGGARGDDKRDDRSDGRRNAIGVELLHGTSPLS